jgi:lysyl endopeptidase
VQYINKFNINLNQSIMKIFTKTIATILLIGGAFAANAQTYCTPAAVALQSGITNFNLNTLDRTSAIEEGYSGLNTETTTLTIGQSYTASITASGTGCSNTQVKVYIDWNDDGDFGDANEQVLYEFDQPYGTFTQNFTVPTGAATGSIRVRVAEKWATTPCVHDEIEECGVDVSIGVYHGEMEDYEITVDFATGIDGIEKLGQEFKVYSTNSGINLNYGLNKPAEVSMSIMNITGQTILNVAEGDFSKGTYSYNIDRSEFPSFGIYLVRLTVDGIAITKKVIIK